MTAFFITGTDTDIGKTAVARAVIASMPGDIVAFKPVVSGTDLDGPSDTVRLASVAARTIVPHEYGPPVSPHLAAELAGDALVLDELVAAARAAGEGADGLVVEGVGGLLVPLNATETVRDLAVELGFPLVVVAKPGLGTISHTLLTLESARSAGLDVAAVVLTPWPGQPSVMEESNRATIARMGEVRVDVLGMDALALPVAEWRA